MHGLDYVFGEIHFQGSDFVYLEQILEPAYPSILSMVDRLRIIF